MDRSIGRLRKSLQERGLRDNTLLFYCGDNGTSADAALGFPHRGHKAQIYEGGTLVPGLIEWPKRIIQQRTSNFRASTSDLLPTLCSLTNVRVPERPIDGIDLTQLIDGSLQEREQALHFWEYDTSALVRSKPEPWIAPHLQEGTTPLVKLMGGKATRDFVNYRQPRVADADYSGAKSIIAGRYKLIVQSIKNGDDKIELFNLENDISESENLASSAGSTLLVFDVELTCLARLTVFNFLLKKAPEFDLGGFLILRFVHSPLGRMG